MSFQAIKHAFHNSFPLELKSGLLPFGAEPLRFDTFSISSPELFSKKGAQVTLNTTLQTDLTAESIAPVLSWEYFDGRGWQVLPLEANDHAKNFRVSGSIAFTVPDDIAEGEVAGIMGYWIRARLTDGDYGRITYTVDCDNGSLDADSSTLHAPRLSDLVLEIGEMAGIAAEHILTQNNLEYLNHSQANLEQNASFGLYRNAASINGYLNIANQQPEASRALYFGFSKPFNIRPLSLYVDAVEQERNMALEFEILARDDWRKVNAIDATAGFHRRGFAQVFVDFKPRLARLFGKESYWLRVKPHASESKPQSWSPQLRGVFINAVQAEQARTIANEPLGSTAGEPNLTLLLSNFPVLPHSLELRIRENLSDEERAAPWADAPADLPERDLPVRHFDDPSLSGDWVLWKPVDSFIGHGAEERIYRLDPVTGEIQFGDDRHGRIPPAGGGHIRAIRYQTGGGVRGNTGAYTITGLKSAIEGVETVTNPVQAAGGADAPTLAEQMAEAPARLRRSGRAMTPPDIEALAEASSPDLIRARCLYPQEPGGPIQVAIIIRNGQRCPAPTLAEKDGLARLIREQAWGGLRQEDIRVVTPQFVPVTIDLSVTPDSNANIAKLEQAATERIRLLLHPADGGPDGGGWPFGRRLWDSDILRALAEIPSFDSATILTLAPKEAGMDFTRMPVFGVICAQEEDITIRIQPREDD
ncbi:MAG: baseplate J/gp47 family protein [Gammaproteobacteria bacterium]|nr:baseplate J/gp47 family protein [Gammaproteobacteria bacterium]MBU1723003.1 baseplate J/gp47 family protein [Gammaproteobacteria bacterium]MBU2003804.1 baseplate J/gp47 family protein [Gammaproteobacteria bacterium]